LFGLSWRGAERNLGGGWGWLLGRGSFFRNRLVSHGGLDNGFFIVSAFRKLD
jgi:hypothetical protein